MDTGFDPATWNRLHQQLPIGKEGERKVAEDLIELGYKINQTEGKHNYDLSATTKSGRLVKIEVKTDLLAHITGNVGIEFKQNGKPSGIQTTESDIWCWYIKGINQIYYFETSTVKSFIDKELHHMKKETINSHYYLISLDKIKQYAKLIRIKN